MPKITDEPLEAIQLRLFKSDLDKLREMYSGSFGVNKALRTIVRSFLIQTQAKADKLIDQDEIEIDETELEKFMETL